MRHEIKEKLLKFLSDDDNFALSVDNRERDLLIYDVKAQLNYFEISSLHKDDIIDVLPEYKKINIDSSDMETIANKLGQDYTEQLFWGSLPIIVKKVMDE